MNYYNIRYEDVTKQQRSFSKPPVLGCGYMLGWKGLIAYAEGYGVEMTKEQSKNAVDTFRNMYPEIPKFWKWIDNAVKCVIQTGQRLEGYRLRLERDSEFFRVWLPSGRAISYYKPEVQMRPAPWDAGKLIPNASYMGMDDKNQWTRIYAHAGLFTENIVQSLAMDILFQGLTNAVNCGLTPVLQVHDEIGCEEPKHEAEARLAVLRRCMTEAPAWAEGMWLGADGYTCDYYTKD